jgi:hypothetical protein
VGGYSALTHAHSLGCETGWSSKLQDFEGEAVNQEAHREKVIAENSFTRLRRACPVDRAGNGSHDLVLAIEAVEWQSSDDRSTRRSTMGLRRGRTPWHRKRAWT